MEGNLRRVMRLGDPGLNELAVLPSTDWPELAARWLIEGYDSQALRDFAAFTPAEAAVLSDLMADVLRSLGVEVDQTEGFEDRVFEISGFAQRCRVALRPVQQDLDRTGHSQFQMQPFNATGHGWPPQAHVALPDGRGSTSFGLPMAADMDDQTLVGVATDAACETLLLVAHVRWPRCVQCNADDKHPVSPVGELTETT